MKMQVPSTEEFEVVKHESFLMRKHDWHAIKRMVKSRYEKPKWVSITYPLFFGITITSIFSVLSLWYEESIAEWIIPTCITVAISSFIFGLILLFVDNTNSKSHIESTNNITVELDAIEKQYEIAPDNKAHK